MSEIRFAYYKAKFQWRNVFRKGKKIKLVDDGIALFTWLPNLFTPWYSHLEVMIRGKDGTWKNGVCYTSTMRSRGEGEEKINGTVSRSSASVFTHPERWDFQQYTVDDELFDYAVLVADQKVQDNEGYALISLPRFVMPLPLLRMLKMDAPEKEICSEHGEGWALILKLLDAIRIRSPRRVWRDLTRKWYTPTYSMATGHMVRDGRGKKVRGA